MRTATRHYFQCFPNLTIRRSHLDSKQTPKHTISRTSARIGASSLKASPSAAHSLSDGGATGPRPARIVAPIGGKSGRARGNQPTISERISGARPNHARASRLPAPAPVEPGQPVQVASARGGGGARPRPPFRARVRTPETRGAATMGRREKGGAADNERPLCRGRADRVPRSFRAPLWRDRIAGSARLIGPVAGQITGARGAVFAGWGIGESAGCVRRRTVGRRYSPIGAGG